MKTPLARTPLIYLITDRKQLAPSSGQSDITRLLDFIKKSADAGVDIIQIREKDLPARGLYLLVESAVALLSGCKCRLLVNDRADIAASFPGVGVHLTSTSVPPADIRRAFGDELLIGVSTHSAEEVRSAEQGGADFVVFGPVFKTLSKRQYGPPQGLQALSDVVEASTIPVIGLGGIDISNYLSVLSAGAVGIAGISWFAQTSEISSDITCLAKKLKGEP